MSEVVGDAACLVDPTNIEEMTSVMSELLQNRQRRKERIEKGLERVRSYTWQNVSESYLKLYQAIIGSV